MSFIHFCAVGFFEPESLSIGRCPRVVRPLDRALVESLATHHGLAMEEGPYAVVRWQEGYVVVKYVSIRVLSESVQFARALVKATGASACEIRGASLLVIHPTAIGLANAGC